MGKLFIKELKTKDTVDTVLVVKQKQIKKTQAGDDYLILKLADRSGEIEGRMWSDFGELAPQISEGTFLRVYGEATEYLGKKQLKIKKLMVLPADQVEISEFVPHTKKHIEEMFSNLTGLIETFTDQDLKKLLQLIFSDKELTVQYKKAPAAVSMHSACIGGLLEHVDGMLNLALFVAQEYPQINRDMLIAGIILHDIGKTKELDYNMVFKYNDYGNLVGHITIGVEMLNDKIKQISDFPFEKKMLLEHMILSHHGVPEFGSPRYPATLEAIALHYIDNLDAKLVGFNDFVENNKQPDSKWTPRAYMFDNRELYIGERD